MTKRVITAQVGPNGRRRALRTSSAPAKAAPTQKQLATAHQQHLAHGQRTIPSLSRRLNQVFDQIRNLFTEAEEINRKITGLAELFDVRGRKG